MANAASNLGMSVGVYSSEYEWSATVGESCTSLNGYPLWYAHYDGDPSFDVKIKYKIFFIKIFRMVRTILEDGAALQ
jgi:hypothetical protein